MPNEHDVRHEALWSFETVHFFVGFYAEPEDMDPADSLVFPEDIEAVRSGSVDWFCAALRVYFKAPDGEWIETGSDYLGGCAYDTARSFAEGVNRNGYFRDMVREAVGEARKFLGRFQGLPLRSVEVLPC